MDAERSGRVARRSGGADRAGPAQVATGVVAAVLLAAGCSSGAAPQPSAPPSSSPAPVAPASSAPSSQTSSPGTSPSSASSSAGPAVPVDLPDEVLLPSSALPVPEGPREVSRGVAAWYLPDGCGAGEPGAAVAMTSVQQGDGLYEVPVGVQQVAVHADAAAAQVEAQRVGAALAACAGGVDDGSSSRYLVAPAAVGADGTELTVDYYGVTASDPSADGLGYAVVVLRRGSAVTLVAAQGGEDSLSHSRTVAGGLAQAAWERLCRYTVGGVDGCGA